MNMLFFYVFYIQRTQMHDLNIFEWHVPKFVRNSYVESDFLFSSIPKYLLLVVLKDFVAKPQTHA